jgi:hypothetical protein
MGVAMHTIRRNVWFERLIWALVVAASLWFAKRQAASADLWKMAAIRATLNPELKQRIEIDSKGMRSVADLPCGKTILLWTVANEDLGR